MKILNKKDSIIQSLSWVVIGNVITKPLWALLFIYAARRLGSEGFGIFTYATSIASIVGIFVDLGLDYIYIREIARNKSAIDNYFSQILCLRIGFFLFIFSVMIITFLISGYNPNESYAILIVLVFQVLTILITYLKSVTSAFQDFKLFSKFLMIEKLLVVMGGTLGLIFSSNILVFIISITTGNIVAIIIIYTVLLKKFELVLRVPKFLEIKTVLHEAIPLIFLNLFIVFYFRIDVFILKYISQDISVIGIYGSIHRLIEMYLLLPTILMSLAYPIISKNYYTNYKFVENFVSLLIKIMLLFSIPLAVVISTNSYEINKIIFGDNYLSGSEGLLYIIWAIVPLGLNYLLGNLLVSVKKEKLSALSVGIASIFSISLNVLMIPLLSFVGTSIVVVIVELIILFLYSLFVLKHFGKIKIVDYFLKSIGIVVTSLLLVNVVNYLFSPSLIIGIVLSLIIVFCLFYVWRIFSLKELKNLIEILRTSHER